MLQTFQYDDTTESLESMDLESMDQKSSSQFEIGSSFMKLRHREGLGGTVKCLPTVWETRVQFLGREDPLEKEMATHSGTLAWKIPWVKEPGRLQSMGSRRVGHD